MSSVILTGDTSGTLTVSAPLVAGSNTVTLPAATGTISLLTQATSVTASGTSVDFTGIPSWVKRITVMFDGVSTNGSSLVQVQLGDSGGIENTGYLSSGSIGTSFTQSNLTSGFNVDNSASASGVRSLVGTLVNVSGNAWVWGSVGTGTGFTCVAGGSKSLSATLDRIRITTVNGTDTFDAGSINIMYEG
jgi:hypothetical protein